MRKSILGLSALSILAVATPALAQDESEWSISGNAAIVSDYRFRGFSQNNENAAIQGGLDLGHESGFYVGTWGSSIGFAGNTEIDIYAGYSTDLMEGLSIDAGVLYYLYPKHGAGDTDFFEPYVTLSTGIGPVSVDVGVNYAWSQAALGDNSAIYFHSESSVAVPGTPLSIDAHVGYADSDGFPGGTGADHHVWDYSIGASVSYDILTFGVAYVATDEARFRGAPLAGTGAEAIGADGAVIFTIGAEF